MKKKIVATKNFVCRHKVAIAVTGTAATCLYLNHLALAEHNEFLKEHGLYAEYYFPEN